MPNSKLRCAGCRDYFPRADAIRVGMSNVCSRSCARAVQDRARTTVSQSATTPSRRGSSARGPSRGGDIPAATRERVKVRDRGKCRMCGQPAHHLHHINYRSEGVDHSETNLISLCEPHHRLVHTSKAKWKPLLRAVIWKQYVEGQRITALQATRWLS